MPDAPLPFVDVSDLGPRIVVLAVATAGLLGGLVVAAQRWAAEPPTPRAVPKNRPVPALLPPPAVDVSGALREQVDFRWDALLDDARARAIEGLTEGARLDAWTFGAVEAVRALPLPSHGVEHEGTDVVRLSATVDGSHALVDVWVRCTDADRSWRARDRLRLVRRAPRSRWSVLSWCREDRMSADSWPDAEPYVAPDALPGTDPAARDAARIAGERIVPGAQVAVWRIVDDSVGSIAFALAEVDGRAEAWTLLRRAGTWTLGSRAPRAVLTGPA